MLVWLSIALSGNPPIIRGELINLIWESVFKMIFNEEVKPPLTFEEVHIIQHRLDEHVESIKYRIQMQMMTEPDEIEPPKNQTYIK